jgi:UDP-N-acetylmuramoyl-tripeptide--D-alanyl-D-alanine ligase
LNADDPRVAAMQAVHPGRSITFGMSADAAVRATEVEEREDGVRFRAEGTDFECPMPGRLGVLNVLAGLAVCRHFGIAAADVREAVRTLVPGTMRMERLTHHGITVWNDCYNSNPDAVRAMLDVLGKTPARRRIAVLGEMLELGRWTEALHREVGNYVAQAGISVLVGIRGAARCMVDAAIVSGLPYDAAFFFDEPESAGDFVREFAQPGDAILFKGSRGTHVEKALERFLG